MRSVFRSLESLSKSLSPQAVRAQCRSSVLDRLHIGNPAEIGIANISSPDYQDKLRM